MATEYKIKITYETGNSFGTSQEEGEVPIMWKDIRVAKQALAWIKHLNEVTEHHKNTHACRLSYSEMQDELRKLPCGCQEYPEVAMMLPRDDGTLRQISTFWRGYFERLICAEIVVNSDPDMVYKP